MRTRPLARMVRLLLCKAYIRFYSLSVVALHALGMGLFYFSFRFIYLHLLDAAGVS